jgi:hypothetical protein
MGSNDALGPPGWGRRPGAPRLEVAILGPAVRPVQEWLPAEWLGLRGEFHDQGDNVKKEYSSAQT